VQRAKGRGQRVKSKEQERWKSDWGRIGKTGFGTALKGRHVLARGNAPEI